MIPSAPPGFAGGSATGLSVTDACGHTAVDDAPKLGPRDVFVRSPGNIGTETTIASLIAQTLSQLRR